MEFTLISEGFLHNQNLHDDAVILRVRLNTIINSRLGEYFSNEFMPVEDYIKSLIDNDGKKLKL